MHVPYFLTSRPMKTCVLDAWKQQWLYLTSYPFLLSTSFCFLAVSGVAVLAELKEQEGAMASSVLQGPLLVFCGALEWGPVAWGVGLPPLLRALSFREEGGVFCVYPEVMPCGLEESSHPY